MAYLFTGPLTGDAPQTLRGSHFQKKKIIIHNVEQQNNLRLITD